MADTLVIIPAFNEEKNIANVIERLTNTLNDVDDELKHITLFAMQPLEGGNFKQAILGYSIMHAMGIKASPSPSKGGDVLNG
mgnify:CR=1 FL=1